MGFIVGRRIVWCALRVFVQEGRRVSGRIRKVCCFRTEMGQVASEIIDYYVHVVLFQSAGVELEKLPLPFLATQDE